MALTSACAAGHHVVRRDTAGLAAIQWFGPKGDGDVNVLARWRAGVGPPVVRDAASQEKTRADEITVVSWNTAVGGADVLAFARTLPPGAPVVMMLQEVYRDGPEVPGELERDAVFAGFLGGLTAARSLDVEAIAGALGMSVYYVPSMRNGSPLASKEDRGNAILSNLPLRDLAAIELPFERQRRVAVAATVSGTTAAGTPWRVRVVSAHLDNVMGVKRAWLGGEYGRARQARGLRDALDDDTPTVLAGDFNTWFGFSEQAYIETALAFPDTRMSDRRPTFHGLLRLDHVFYRLGRGWRASFRRGDDRFGSDHFPLVGTIRFR